MGLIRRIAVAFLGALALAGCKPQVGPGKPAESDGYSLPPVVESATRTGEGVRLSGHSSPDALIRLRSPDGSQATARADVGGAWALDLPPSELPRLYAFEAVVADKTVRSEGALAVMPPPGPAALILRAGSAAQAISPFESGGLRLFSLDYDGGAAAVGGVAAPHSSVRLTIDSIVRVGETDGQGRFAILAADPGHALTAGVHQVKVETPQGLVVQQTVTIAEPAIPADKVFAGARIDDGWIVNWRLPGGGVQTSMIFDDAAASRTSPP